MDDEIMAVAEALSAYEEVREMGSTPAWSRMVLEMQKRAKAQREILEDILDRFIQAPMNPEAIESFRHAKAVLLGYEFAVNLYRELRERSQIGLTRNI